MQESVALFVRRLRVLRSGDRSDSGVEAAGRGEKGRGKAAAVVVGWYAGISLILTHLHQAGAVLLPVPAPKT